MISIEEIISDNYSGSGTILKKVQQWLSELAKNPSAFDTKEMLQLLDQLETRFPFFGLLQHFLEDFKKTFSGSEFTCNDMNTWLKSYQKKWVNSQDKASLNMISEIDFSDKQVLVHSNSSALHKLFHNLKSEGIDPQVWQTWSSPAGEGVLQVEVIANLGFKVNLIHENAVSKFIDQIDFAVFGADMVLEKQFINKAGTFPIALLFNHYKKPVYVLAETRKIIEEVENTIVDSEKVKPTNKLYQGGNKNIDVYNQYFEATPLTLIKKIFLEK